MYFLKMCGVVILLSILILLNMFFPFEEPPEYKYQHLSFKNNLCPNLCESSLAVDYPLATQNDSMSKTIRKVVMDLLNHPEAYAKDSASLEKIFNQWDACEYASSCENITQNERDAFCIADSIYSPVTCYYEHDIEFTYSHQTWILVFYDYFRYEYDLGAAHGYVTGRGTFMFDKRTGAQITAEDIFKNYDEKSLRKTLLDLAKPTYRPEDEDNVELGEVYPENGNLMTGWRDCCCSATCDGVYEKILIPFSKVKDLIRPEALIYYPING